MRALISVTTATVVAVSFCAGYFAGSGRHIHSKISSQASLKTPDATAAAKQDSDDEDQDSESDSEAEPDIADVSTMSIEPLDECKMVLVVRTDLRMSSGKIAAQCSHAALACYKTMKAHNPTLLRQWERAGQTKIALQCSNEDELLVMQAQAQSLNLCAKSIRDAGRTQIEAGSRTVLGIAGPVRLVNQVTGKLRLL